MMKEDSKHISRPYSAELYHYALKHANKDFKYIRKEMINGKMRYYYEDNKGRNPKSTQLINKDDRTKLVSNVSKLRNPATDKSRLLTKDEKTKSDVYNAHAPIDDSPIETVKDLPKQSTSLSKEENQKRVNPDYSPFDRSYSTNCMNCVATHELRTRGYDVEARPHTDDYEGYDKDIVEWYKDTDMSDYVLCWSRTRTADDLGSNSLKDMLEDRYADYSLLERVFRDDVDNKLNFYIKPNYIQHTKEELLRYGESARGQLSMKWTDGSGHVVTWSVENNEVVIRDSQTNKTCTLDEFFEKYGDYINDWGYLRTDNREISDEILKTCRRRRGLNNG